MARTFLNYDWTSALFSGFEFSVLAWMLAQGPHRVAIRIKSKAGVEQVSTFGIEVQPGPWPLRDRISRSERLFVQALITELALHPKFYISVHCRAANAVGLEVTLRSLVSQAYQGWELVVTGGGDNNRRLEHIVQTELHRALEVPNEWVAKAPAEKPSEVRDGKSSAFTAPSLSRGRSGDAECVTLASRVHVSPSDNEAGAIIRNARAHDFMLPLEAGDILSADALFELARAVNSDRGADFIYADERRVNIASEEVEPFLKPDWSPVLLMATNYVGRPWCARLDLLRSIGRVVFRPGAMDNFDLVLACTESASRVLHVRKLLAERGAGNIESEEAEVRALQNALRRRHLDWVVDAGRITGTYRCRPKVQAHDLVSIIICTCGARGLIKTCIESLRAHSTYKDIEVIVIDNTAGAGTSWKPWLRANADVLIETSEPFNWSRFNNMAAGKASGSYLLFLNDDTEVIHPDWLEALLEPFASRDVAIAGPQLLYPDRRVQHAGMLLAGPALPRHAFRSHAENDPGYFGLALTQREVIAVTGACMMVRADAFREAGGFDEGHAITYNDVDFCLRMHARGLRCVYTPFARLLHHEIASREGLNEEYDREAFHRRWSGSRVGMHGDPYFHPLLDPHSDSYRPQLPVQPQRSTSL